MHVSVEMETAHRLSSFPHSCTNTFSVTHTCGENLTPVSLHLFVFLAAPVGVSWTLSCRRMSFTLQRGRFGWFLWSFHTCVFECCQCEAQWLVEVVVTLLGVHSWAFASCESQPALPLCHCLTLPSAGKTNKLELMLSVFLQQLKIVEFYFKSVCLFIHSLVLLYLNVLLVFIRSVF